MEYYYINITDYTDSIVCKMFTKDEEEKKFFLDNIKPGKWYKCKGNIAYNQRSNDYEYSINSMEEFDKETIKRVDNAEVKELNYMLIL